VIERSYPGVYVTEVPAHPTPIEGVPTTLTGADALRYRTHEGREATRLPAATPEWTDANQGDPGITLLQALAYGLDALVPWAVSRHGAAGRLDQAGAVAGLGADGETSRQVHITKAVAAVATGRRLVEPSATAVDRNAAAVNFGDLFSLGAVPSKYQGPDLAASANDVAIEPIELDNEGIAQDEDPISDRHSLVRAHPLEILLPEGAEMTTGQPLSRLTR
jgi:hypothetical protein